MATIKKAIQNTKQNIVKTAPKMSGLDTAIRSIQPQVQQPAVVPQQPKQQPPMNLSAAIAALQSRNQLQTGNPAIAAVPAAVQTPVAAMGNMANMGYAPKQPFTPEQQVDISALQASNQLTNINNQQPQLTQNYGMGNIPTQNYGMGMGGNIGTAPAIGGLNNFNGSFNQQALDFQQANPATAQPTAQMIEMAKKLNQAPVNPSLSPDQQAVIARMQAGMGTQSGNPYIQALTGYPQLPQVSKPAFTLGNIPQLPQLPQQGLFSTFNPFGTTTQKQGLGSGFRLANQQQGLGSGFRLANQQQGLGSGFSETPPTTSAPFNPYNTTTQQQGLGLTRPANQQQTLAQILQLLQRR